MTTESINSSEIETVRNSDIDLTINQQSIEKIDSSDSKSYFNKIPVISQTQNYSILTNEEHSEQSRLLNLSNLTQKNELIYKLLKTIDILFSLFIFGPLVSFYWNFTWEFLDEFFLKNNQKLSNFLSWGIGLIIVLPSYIFQKDLQRFNIYLESFTLTGRFLKILFRTVYIYLVTLGIVLEWRGLWNLIDIYFFKDWQSQLALAIFCISFLCLTRATKTLLSNPFILYKDDYSNFYTTESKHKLPISDYPQFSFDFVLCEIVECLALTSAWKGFDNLSNVFIYPYNMYNSLIASFSISHISFVFIIIAQKLVFKPCSKLSLFPRILVEDFFNLLMFAVAILYWKFYWDIMYFHVFNRFNGLVLFYICLIGHFVSFFIAVCLKITGLLAGPGTKLLDGEYSSTSNSYLDIDYLASVYKNQFEINENENSRMQIQGWV